MDIAPTSWHSRFSQIVQALAEETAARHGNRLKCQRGCADCCVDALTVFELEADAIRAAYPALLADGAPHPVGRCAMLDAHGACRIYEHRPYVCRTQGLPLRWLEHDDTGQAYEARDICPLNAEGPSLASLGPEDCWTIGPFEDRLAAAQATHPAGPDARVSLRDLFTRPASTQG